MLTTTTAAAVPADNLYSSVLDIIGIRLDRGLLPALLGGPVG
jgi:hypothetical protein